MLYYFSINLLAFNNECRYLIIYLNNIVVFLSRLIVAPRKFDVLKTNICPRSEVSRANMLVLRTSNYQTDSSETQILFIVHH